MEEGFWTIFPIRWMFFFALFPIAFFWLRRAYRILVKHDFSEVALKRGEPPPNAEKYAAYEMGINLLAGIVMVVVILSVLLALLDYDDWVAISGVTLWLKIFASFALSRHAHGIDMSKSWFRSKRKDKESSPNSNPGE
jgi:hypothetical protein